MIGKYIGITIVQSDTGNITSYGTYSSITYVYSMSNNAIGDK